MKLIILFLTVCLASLSAHAYEADFLGWKTSHNGRFVSKLPSKESACDALLQKLIDTNGLNLNPPHSPWSIDVLLHPIDQTYYFCVLKPADNIPGNVWGAGWGALETEYACPQPHSKLVYPTPNYAYAVPECVCESPYYEKGGMCVPRNITINGASSTMALPSEVGPIAQQVNVEMSGDENKKFTVIVSIKESKTNTSYSISGVTDSAGNFEFMYVPPYMRSTNVDLTANCADCENTASKSISVSWVDTAPPQDPQMCRR
ncbi:hypothetical protein ACFIQG_20455 [Comamonas odontotermitis]|uniref:hypothetical protein n=1 Tax=Comamonas odontotermitis TaxID=379895 RepID=UPI00366DCD84